MSLIKKLNEGAVIGLATVMLNGCATTPEGLNVFQSAWKQLGENLDRPQQKSDIDSNDNTYLATVGVLAGAWGVQNGRPGVAYLGDSIAQQNKPATIVNIPQPSQSYVSSESKNLQQYAETPLDNPKLLEVFTANWSDNDNNGIIDSERELQESGNFSYGNAFYLIIRNHSSTGFHLKYEMINNKTGEVINDKEMLNEIDVGPANLNPASRAFCLRGAAVGDYKVKFFLNGRKFSQEIEFKVE